jgi:hypothetical protein
MMKATLTWTGEQVRNAGLLYQNYEDRADVQYDDKVIGEVLHLASGYYQPRVPGIRGEDCPTAHSAMRKVVAMHRKYRA